ncbi:MULTISPECIES: VOC family protein [unclassified Roseovarius]|uniref:VOC family protein n=1 Tax=unclassified Roseovarius TaxID=2614913 RepID=UPI00273D624C|nr:MULTISPECIES: VOC family protein [unclassified Roseovarius]
MLELDHLAISAETLEEGRAYAEAALGVRLQPGGQHPHFGTHNVLLGLEDGLYLEVIAIDPTAPKPPYPRWFDLDRFAGTPRITNWICRANNLTAAVASYPGAGRPVALERGDLRWQMAVPDTGILPYDGMFPPLIEWSGTAHPAQRLTASGCRLTRLMIRHPRAADLQSEISAELADDRIAFEQGPCGFNAEFATPAGPRVLE